MKANRFDGYREHLGRHLLDNTQKLTLTVLKTTEGAWCEFELQGQILGDEETAGDMRKAIALLTGLLADFEQQAALKKGPHLFGDDEMDSTI